MDNKYYDFPFYKWEKEKANDPFLRQPFGDNWEEYTRSEEHTSELQSHS